MMKKDLLFLSLVFLASSCTFQNSSQAPAVVSSSILGGEQDVEDSFNAVVELRINKEDESYLCTATVIDKHLVLTAGHCVDSSDFLTNHRFTAHYLKNGVKKTFDFKGSALLRHPLDPIDREKVNIFEFDTALVRVDTDLSQYVRPIPLVAQDEISKLVRIGSMATLVGYGLRGGGRYGDLRMKVETAYSFTLKNVYMFMEEKRNASLGDSGGPAIMFNDQGEPRVIGNLSFVGEKTGFSGYVRASTMINLIDFSKATKNFLAVLRNILQNAKNIENKLNHQCPDEMANVAGMIDSGDEIFYSNKQEIRFSKSICSNVQGFIKVVLLDIEQALITYTNGKQVNESIKFKAIVTDRAGKSGKGFVELMTDENNGINEIRIYDNVTSGSSLVNLRVIP